MFLYQQQIIDALKLKDSISIRNGWCGAFCIEFEEWGGV